MEIFYGILAGIITGLGMGGGTILILLLSLSTDLSQHELQATNLIFFIPTSIAAIYNNFKNKNVDKKIVLIVSVFGIIRGNNRSFNITLYGRKLIEKIFCSFCFINRNS